MSFFKKVLGGITKPFRKVLSKTWKGIKSGFKKVMGFIGKLGIVGQIGLSLLLPGLGEIVSGWALTMMGSGSAIISGAGHVLNAAINIGTKIKGVVGSVTKGIGKVVGQTVGTVLNKIPRVGDFIKDITLGKIDITKMTDFSDIGDVFSKELGNISSATSDLFSKGTFTDLNSFAKDALMKTQMQESLARTLEEGSTSMFDKTGALKTPESILAESQDFNFDMGNAKMEGLDFEIDSSILQPSALADNPLLPRSVVDPSQLNLGMNSTRNLEQYYKGVDTPQGQGYQVGTRLSDPTPSYSTSVRPKGLDFDPTELEVNMPANPSLLEAPAKLIKDKNGFYDFETTNAVAKESLATKAGKKLAGSITKDKVLASLDSSGVGTYEGGYGGGTSFDVPDMGPMTAGGMTAQEINFFNLVPSLEIRGLTLPANYQPQSNYSRAMAKLDF
tara:strand:- start:3823 stop:5157 length:1335 start_codon:yes stop_codon:yes gene_type:complete